MISRGKTTTTADPYSYYSTEDYFKSLKTNIDGAKAGDRIILVTLWLRAEQPDIQLFVDALCAAAKRGAAVLLLIDAFNFLIKEGTMPGPAYYFGPSAESSKFVSPIFRKRQAALEELRRAGVRTRVINHTNRAFSNPFKGRSHIKFSIINNYVYIGGCNLGDQGFIDVMAGWEDQKIATWLCNFAEDIYKSGRVSTALNGKDTTIAIDKTTTLLVDAGERNQSLILDTAFSVIDSAKKSVLITYQYFPHGLTAQHLLAAVERGVALTAYYNHPAKHKFPLNIIYGYMAHGERKRGPAEFSSHRLSKLHSYLHAKLVVGDERIVLSSHNYMTTGVKLGTAEIGMVSTNPAFVAGTEAAFRKQIAALD